MTAYTSAAFLCIIVPVISGIVMAVWMHFAPVGYEDETGFHKGER